MGDLDSKQPTAAVENTTLSTKPYMERKKGSSVWYSPKIRALLVCAVAAPGIYSCVSIVKDCRDEYIGNMMLEDRIIEPSRRPDKAKSICDQGPGEIEKTRGWCPVMLQTAINAVRAACSRVYLETTGDNDTQCVKATEVHQRLQPAEKELARCRGIGRRM